jgi:hypothetical protein
MRIAAGIGVALTLLLAPGAGAAGDLRGARIETLRGELQSLQGRAPRERVYELKQLQRRLDEQRVDRPDDPRLGRLELQRRHDQWQAERALRRGRAAVSRARLAGGRDQLAAPGYLRGPTDLDIRGTALPIGTGKLFLFIQSGLRAARDALGRGQTGAAAGHLAGAESGLRALRAEAAADDPNVVALTAELAALQARVAAGSG